MNALYNYVGLYQYHIVTATYLLVILCHLYVLPIQSLLAVEGKKQWNWYILKLSWTWMKFEVVKIKFR